MQFFPNNLYHIYNQGNNRQKIFLERRDYLIFLNLYKRLFSPNVHTICWCLMPNHFHFMVYTDERCDIMKKQGGIFLDPVNNAIRKLLSGYARIFNSQNDRSGSLFRQKTKSKCLNEIAIEPGGEYQLQDYFINCFHYIHQNPVAAKLVADPKDWEFSSFPDYSGSRDGNLCNKNLAILYCGYEPGNLVKRAQAIVDGKMIDSFFEGEDGDG